MDLIAECHHVAGGDAFILKVVAASVEELERLVEKLLDFGVPTTSVVFSSPVVGPVTDLPARYWISR
jgi:Lrp/AsnC family leucine-responsive transcriptional regulator